MDRFIAAWPAEQDGDLSLCIEQGVAYQTDRKFIINYDEPYYSKCASYDDQEIANKINAGRIAFVERHYGPGMVVDIGIGSGEFIRKRPLTHGYDINPVGEEWLKRNNLWAHHLCDYSAFSMWDVIEHCPEPEAYLRQMNDAYLFISIPVFDDLRRIRDSKHYRPGEHLQHWTDAGFVSWMALHGFQLLERQDFEIAAGRDSIMSYAFFKARS